MLDAALTGFFLSFSLILAIGAQNAFVLRQGVLGNHIGWLCLFCAVSDAVLIALGVIGADIIALTFPWFRNAMIFLGAGFLICYGASRFWAAWRANSALEVEGDKTTLKIVMLNAAAFTWLNPHVYLDTLALVGAVSTDYSARPEKLVFAISAVAASFVFFFSLGYGARLLRPIMRAPKSWRVLDIGVGVVMWIIAVKLLWKF